MVVICPFMLLPAYSVLAAFCTLMRGLWAGVHRSAYKHNTSPKLHPTGDIQKAIPHDDTIAALFPVLPKSRYELTNLFYRFS